ncbi:type I secretion system ATPase [Desulfurobacterium thermolithotrophum DSM 11699]|uniref:Type I secretion system ATPase n=1 Tax=Desulfurobacterium thermolithotrophum (strain DSM 11699 / BSA) TaxID=868864 RepID=F0S180_DESTD|nr:type I secretion system permease/ATPase [Desulfurobacterium thermolithotrophum]ADY73958.1 type I secretion system ATPase [Desulfurobacterium thermolithotrophum DSM 11699]
MIKKVVLEGNKTQEEKDIIREFLSYTRKSFLFAGFFSLFINLLMLLPAIYMLAVYDIVVPSRSVSTLIFITLLVVALYIISGLLQTIRSRILVRINNKIDSILNKKVINSTFDLALKHPTRASIQPLNDFQQIKQFLTGPTIFAFFDIPWTPIYLGVLFIFHPYYGFMATGVIVVVALITFLNEITTKKYLKKANESLIKSNRFMNHVIQNVEVIEAMGMRSKVYKKWLQLHQKYVSTLQKASDKGAFWSNATKTFRIMSQSLMLGLGGYLALNLEISTGMIVAGSIVLGRVLAPIDLMINSWRSFSSARLSYKRLNQLLNTFAEKPKPMKLPPPKGAISLEQVVVVPPDAKNPSLKNITMQIPAGEIVAVIGPSGAGKSSLARTLLGIWTPVAGKVAIDSADLKQWDREYLGQFIGYLPQDIELFEGTVAENIARFSEVDPEKVLEAARISGAHEVIVNLPDGYNTYIGPGGITLSGGQRQRIALARALYGNPRIVILDEPNSNLDDAGERALLNALWELKKRKVTVIVISHKINILELVDKIAFLQDGMLKMYGDAKTVLQQLTKQRGN